MYALDIASNALNRLWKTSVVLKERSRKKCDHRLYLCVLCTNLSEI